jgi:hypothetical protein
LASLLRQKEGGDAIVLHTAFGDGSGWRKTLGDGYTNGLGKRERSGFVALRKEAEKDAKRIALSGFPSREAHNLAHPESAIPRRIVLIDDLDDFLREEASLEGEILSLKDALEKSGGCLIATMNQPDERIEESLRNRPPVPSRERLWGNRRRGAWAGEGMALRGREAKHAAAPASVYREEGTH